MSAQNKRDLTCTNSPKTVERRTEKTEKENQQSEVICAKKQKTYTQEEVLAMLEQVQKGEIEK